MTSTPRIYPPGQATRLDLLQELAAQPMAPPGITAGVGVLAPEVVGDLGQAQVTRPLDLVGAMALASAPGQDQVLALDMALEVVGLMAEVTALGLALAAPEAAVQPEEPEALPPMDATCRRTQATEPTMVDVYRNSLALATYIDATTATTTTYGLR